MLIVFQRTNKDARTGKKKKKKERNIKPAGKQRKKGQSTWRRLMDGSTFSLFPFLIRQMHYVKF